jgi:hypothetical protein
MDEDFPVSCHVAGGDPAGPLCRAMILARGVQAWPCAAAGGRNR